MTEFRTVLKTMHKYSLAGHCAKWRRARVLRAHKEAGIIKCRNIFADSENMEQIQDDTFFTFKLGEGIFAMPIRCVREVMNFTSLTPVPNAKPYLKGVMNIRGTVITVVDFRVLFEFPVAEDISKATIIVTEVPQEGEAPLVISMLADGVDVVTPLEFIKAENVAYGVMESRKDFIKAVAKRDNDFILLLDMEKIIDSIEKELPQDEV